MAAFSQAKTYPDMAEFEPQNRPSCARVMVGTQFDLEAIMKKVAVMLLVSILVGCTSIPWTGVTGEIVTANRARSLYIGMPRADVIKTMGRPRDINQTVTANVVYEQFVYQGIYVYLENGKVTAWQQ